MLGNSAELELTDRQGHAWGVHTFAVQGGCGVFVGSLWGACGVFVACFWGIN